MKKKKKKERKRNKKEKKLTLSPIGQFPLLPIKVTQ